MAHGVGQVLLPASGGDDDQPFDLVIDEAVDQAGLPLHLFGRVAEHHPQAVFGGDFLDAERETRVERVGEVGDDQTDHSGAAEPQAARGLVAAVAEPVHRGEDAFARGFGHAGIVLEYP